MRLCCRIVRRSTGYDNGQRAGVGVSCEPGLSITAKYGVAFLRICARRSSFPFPRTLAVCREVARDVSIVIHYDPLPCPCDSRSPQPLQVARLSLLGYLWCARKSRYAHPGYLGETLPDHLSVAFCFFLRYSVHLHLSSVGGGMGADIRYPSPIRVPNIDYTLHDALTGLPGRQR